MRCLLSFRVQICFRRRLMLQHVASSVYLSIDFQRNTIDEKQSTNSIRRILTRIQSHVFVSLNRYNRLGNTCANMLTLVHLHRHSFVHPQTIAHRIFLFRNKYLWSVQAVQTSSLVTVDGDMMSFFVESINLILESIPHLWITLRNSTLRVPAEYMHMDAIFASYNIGRVIVVIVVDHTIIKVFKSLSHICVRLWTDPLRRFVGNENISLSFSTARRDYCWTTQSPQRRLTLRHRSLLHVVHIRRWQLQTRPKRLLYDFVVQLHANIPICSMWQRTECVIWKFDVIQCIK